MELSTHAKRILTAAAVLVLPALAVFYDGALRLAGGWLVFSVLAAFCALGLWEFYAMFWPGPARRGLKIAGVILGALLLAAFRAGSVRLLALVLLAAFWTACLGFLFRFGRDPERTAFPEGLVFLAGLLYLPCAMQFFLVFSPAEMVLVLAAAAVSDTAAYYAGTLWGTAKIWPQVSPKKSWAGSIGGLAACVAVTLAFGLVFGQAAWWAFLLLGALLNLAAQFGDFFESALKRTLGIKDSGTILPGHGGILDRIDSLLLVAPTYGLAREIQPFFG
jgi:phosphatidate cytidylyltransferase